MDCVGVWVRFRLSGYRKKNCRAGLSELTEDASGGGRMGTDVCGGQRESVREARG